MNNTPIIPELMSHKELCKLIGEKARVCRKHLGLSRAQLSKKSGVSVATIGRLEREGVATVSVLIKIATALGVLDTFEGLFSVPKFKSMDEFIKAQRK